MTTNGLNGIESAIFSTCDQYTPAGMYCVWQGNWQRQTPELEGPTAATDRYNVYWHFAALLIPIRHEHELICITENNAK